MAGSSWSSIWQCAFVAYFLLSSYVAVTSSVSLDLTELRNNIAKIKVNPRGNLWATGHFMGKKSVLDSSQLEQTAQDLRELISQEILKIAVKEQKDAQEKPDSSEQDAGELLKMLEKYARSRMM